MKFLLALLLFVSAAAVGGELPSFRELPGHLVLNKCDPFARAAVLKLHKLGIPARRIVLAWGNPYARGWHAALVFQFEGKTYAMDNEHQTPMLVKGKTDLSAARRIIGVDFYTHVWMTDEDNNRVAPTPLATIFTPNPEWLDAARIDKVGGAK